MGKRRENKKRKKNFLLFFLPFSFKEGRERERVEDIHRERERERVTGIESSWEKGVELMRNVVDTCQGQDVEGFHSSHRQ